MKRTDLIFNIGDYMSDDEFQALESAYLKLTNSSKVQLRVALDNFGDKRFCNNLSSENMEYLRVLVYVIQSMIRDITELSDNIDESDIVCLRKKYVKLLILKTDACPKLNLALKSCKNVLQKYDKYDQDWTTKWNEVSGQASGEFLKVQELAKMD